MYLEIKVGKAIVEEVFAAIVVQISSPLLEDALLEVMKVWIGTVQVARFTVKAYFVKYYKE